MVALVLARSARRMRPSLAPLQEVRPNRPSRDRGHVDHLRAEAHSQELALDHLVAINLFDGLDLIPSEAHLSAKDKHCKLGGLLGEGSNGLHGFTCFDDCEGVIAASFGMLALGKEVLGAV